MSATTSAATAPRILAIDLGKYKSVACDYDPGTAEVAFASFDTSRDELQRRLVRARRAVVVIEACALSGWVYDLCVERGLNCRVANTAAEAWKFKHAKRKTDRDDALRLAQLQALGQLPTVVVPPKPVREWRALIAHRQALVGRRVTLQNRLRAILLGQGLAAPVGARAWAAAGLAEFRSHARPLADCPPAELWRGRLDRSLAEYAQVLEHVDALEAALDTLGKQSRAVQLLLTIPGVGPRTAEAVAAYLDDPRRFASKKEVSAYAGLVPRQFQSGELDRRGRITKRGPALLRKLLVECAWCSLRYNPWARQTYMRLSHQGTARKKQAIVALARKLLVRCWAVLRSGQPWREPQTQPA
jgi:transposase